MTVDITLVDYGTYCYFLKIKKARHLFMHVMHILVLQLHVFRDLRVPFRESLPFRERVPFRESCLFLCIVQH